MGKEQANSEVKKNEEKQEIEVEQISVVKVDMHCDACAKKVVKALRRFEGVEDTALDRTSNTIAVKGNIDDPTKLCDVIRSKTGRNALLISPLPKPPPEEKPKDDSTPKVDKDQAPPVVTIVLRVQMHCAACAQLLRKRIRKVKGVESVETNFEKSEVKVTGVIPNPEELAEYVHKKTRKQGSIVKEEEKIEDRQKKKDDVEDNSTTIAEVKRSKHYPGTPGYSSWYSNDMEAMQHYHNSLNHHPQFFSDDNPNACSIM